MKWNPKDKLYVNPYGWNSEPSRKDEVEYIRKDALLEWLENKIKVPDVGFINGLTYLAYQDVIEHLNEM